MRELHSLLGLDKSNPMFEILIDSEIPDELLVHFGMHLLEKVYRGKVEEKLLAARLYNSGFSSKRITEALGFDRKSMRRWGQALKGGDAAAILRAFSGQGAERRMIPMLEHYVRATYRSIIGEMGCHSNEFIRKELREKFGEEFCHEAIRRILRNEDQKILAECEAADIAPESEGDTVSDVAVDIATKFAEAATVHEALSVLASTVGSGVADSCMDCSSERENSCNSDAVSCINLPEKCNYSPVHGDEALPGFPTVKRMTSPIVFCHHAGLTLCRILIDGMSAGFGEAADIIRQWTAMILCGCMNIENGRSLNYQALGILLGEQLCSSDRQREKLHSIAGESVALAMLERNIRMVGASLSDTFLYDPHGIEYTGQLKTLKGWLGSSHKVAKAYYQDFIHTVGGEPVFIALDDNYSDMRMRFIANVAKFRSILGGDKNRKLTFVVDRAIYNVDYLVEMKKMGVEIVTWEKNYRRGQWDTLDKSDIRQITIARKRNDMSDTVTHTVRYVRRSWEKEPSFSQFIVMLAKPNREPVELSVICTDPEQPDADCLIPILGRWLQENDFMFLDKLGINEVTSYKSVSYEEIAASLQDREMVNMERKSQCVKRLELKKELGLVLVSIEDFDAKKEHRHIKWQEQENEIEADAQVLPLDDATIRSRRHTLKTAKVAFIRNEKSFLEKTGKRKGELRQRISEMEESIAGQAESVSRLERIIQDEYRKLNFMPKTVMDCVKIIARNIIYNRLKTFRPIYDNRRNDLVLLRELIEAIGYIQEDGTSVVVSLYPSRHYSKEVRNKIMDFMLELSIEANRFYKPGKTIVFKLHPA